MSFLNALGAIGSGVSAGIQDLRQMDEDKFRKKERERLQKEWDEEDALRTKLKGIQRTKEGWGPGYEASANMPTRDDEGNVMPGVTQVALPRSQQLANEAQAYLGLSNPRLRAQGLTLEQAARQAVQQEREDEKRAKFKSAIDDARPVYERISKNPLAARDWLTEQGASYYNGKVPDGQRVGYTHNEDGSVTATFLDKGNKVTGQQHIPVEQLQNVAKAKLDAMTRHKLGDLGDDEYLKFVMNPNFKERELGIHQQSADAATTNAQTQKDWHAKGGVWESIQREQMKSHERIAALQRTSAKELNPLQQQQLDELKNFAALNDEFAAAMKDPAKNASKLKQLSAQLAQRHPEKSLQVVKVRDADGREEAVSVNRYDHIADEAMKAAGVIQLSPQADQQLKAAATSAKGDAKKFANTPAYKAAVKAGLTDDDLNGYLKPKK